MLKKEVIRARAAEIWQPGGKMVIPDTVKVGPHGYVHGWKFIGVNGAVPLHGHAVQTIEHKRGKTRVDTVHHVFHDGKHIGMITPSPSGKSFTAQPEMGSPKRVKTMEDALDHVVSQTQETAEPAKASPRHPEHDKIDGYQAGSSFKPSHQKAFDKTAEANDDIAGAYSDIKNLALGPKQGTVLSRVGDLASKWEANPKNSAKSIRAALAALGSSNPVAKARLQQSLKKANEAAKAWDDHFGFRTN